MAKLLIVDDEKTTRESLTSYIPWGELRISSVRAARNGLEALSLAAQDPPDLLITDVRMPKMDGIALAERVRSLYPGCKIIFLSGYADKEYLKKAISLRAVGYIEKPIDPAEVQEVARAAMRLSEEELSARQDLAQARSGEQMARALVQGRGTEAGRSFAEDCPFTVAALLVRWNRSLVFASRETARKLILAAWEDLPQELPATFRGFTETEVCAVVAPGKLPEGSPKARALFPVLAQRLSCLGEPGFMWSLGVGAPASRAAGVPSSYEGALQSARRAFYQGYGKVLFPASPRPGRFLASPADAARLRECLRDKDWEQAVCLVRRLAEEARAAELEDIDSVRNAFFDLLLIVLETAGATQGEGPFEESEKTYVWQEIHERATLEELALLVSDNIRALFSDLSPRSKESLAVLEIQRFLRRNYASPGISLQLIADHARLSRTYVSFLFKSVTGENINDYLTRLRIARAKELLRSPGFKACEVAATVGYADSNYFSTIFRKHVGMSPTEFRDSAGPSL